VAAHSAVFTMQLSFYIDEKDLMQDLSTEAAGNFQDGSISNIHLELTGTVGVE
jgi:hypothetical protein